ncbi:RipA family octameric membrane protein [Streptomyces sp. 8N114]|uniref:RipA family octameric membrane protein n=1 Tax=Streptomyces sp. 8N114 TaxID=3457419 RepID=UPI003FD2F532
MPSLPDSLWNSSVKPSTYASGNEQYQAAVLEQYKLCVEMADRVSSRRSLTNTFFLSLNSLIAAGAAGLSDNVGRAPVWMLVGALVVLITQCAAWFVIIRSYRQLNAAKFAVIGALEERLPAFAYSRAEWQALGEGRDWRQYLPLTHVEQWVPLIFSLTYALGFLAVAL